MTPRPPSVASLAISGASPLTAASLGRSTSRSPTELRPTYSGSFESCKASAALALSSAETGAGADCGNSSSMSASWRAAPSWPLRVWKVRFACSETSCRSYTKCALANVAWPQRSTSTAGVNQRKSYSDADATRGRRNAVSLRLNSRATNNRRSSVGHSAPPLSKTTAAGFPPYAFGVKASMMLNGSCATAAETTAQRSGFCRCRPLPTQRAL
mmetsp:Transcript_30816/g.100348  ORF Transcript_30816/g.100348 Transcript_30816/m.100348 type:complete len:213 (-) Transcript_30816:891-1529(-)